MSFFDNISNPSEELKTVFISYDEAGQSNQERESVPLTVSDDYKTTFQSFRTGFREERTLIGDDSLIREADILKDLIDWEGSATAEL